MKVIIEGIILSVCLYLSCAWGIRNGAVHMVFLYDKAVQDRAVKLGLTTEADIKEGRLSALSWAACCSTSAIR